ncbi:hypothetical protein ACLOJK_039964 [Asimina triloba]
MITMMTGKPAGDGESSSNSGGKNVGGGGKNRGGIGSGSSSSSSSFGNNSNNHACAVCRHQRRKCQANCPLAPYFPADKTEEFLNVLRHFGVSNVMKIFNSVDPPLRSDAMESVQYEANARRNDPVNGCLGIIRGLMKQVEEHKRELAFVNDQLIFHTRQRAEQQQQMFTMFEPSPPMPPFQSSYTGFYYPQPPAAAAAADDPYNIGQMKNLNLGNPHDRFPHDQYDQDIKPFHRPTQALEDTSAESIMKIPRHFDHLMGRKMENMVGGSSRGPIL